LKSQEVDRKRRVGLFLQTWEKFFGPEELSESVASSTFDGTSDPMRYIASVIANAVEFSDLHETILEIEWDLKNYVLAEMSAGQALDDMLTLPSLVRQTALGQRHVKNIPSGCGQIQDQQFWRLLAG